MKILESVPQRYDRGIRLLSGGKINKAYALAVEPIEQGQRVLDIGCGTGALSLLAAAKGAQVEAIDINPAMLEVAQARARQLGLTEWISFREQGAVELAPIGEPFDVILSSLCFSELSLEERSYVLPVLYQRLAPHGKLIIVDESPPERLIPWFFYRLLRPLWVGLTWILTQTTTHPIEGLVTEVKQAGFIVPPEGLTRLGSLVIVTAEKGGTDESR